jgi:hypothetical protein
VCFIFVLILFWILEMPKRKKQLAGAVQDAIAKRRKTSELVEEMLDVPKDDSSSIEAITAPDTISSLHGKRKKGAPTATAIADAAATNTALPDVATSLSPADVDADDDAYDSTDAVMDTQSNHIRELPTRLLSLNQTKRWKPRLHLQLYLRTTRLLL